MHGFRNKIQIILLHRKKKSKKKSWGKGWHMKYIPPSQQEGRGKKGDFLFKSFKRPPKPVFVGMPQK